MNYTIIKKLSSAEQIIQSMPLSMENHRQIMQHRREINHILEGKDKRLIMIVGPCSAWPKEAVLKYAEKLAVLNKKLSHKLKIIMRLYIQKPRTTKGWTGPINQPNPCEPPDVEAGVKYSREMMIKVIDMGLPIADEVLFTQNSKGFSELVSWAAIGARSTEDQEHRIFASAFNCAVGLKNPTHGSLSIAVNSVLAAQHPHVAVFENYEVQTHGNKHAHVVLRGNNGSSNYSNADLMEVKNNMDKHNILNPSVIIDTSHDNCIINGQKDHTKQPSIIYDVINNIKDNPELKSLVKGFMVESFIKSGNQKVDEAHPENIDMCGLSITDPCLGYEETEAMLIKLAELL